MGIRSFVAGLVVVLLVIFSISLEGNKNLQQGQQQNQQVQEQKGQQQQNQKAQEQKDQQQQNQQAQEQKDQQQQNQQVQEQKDQQQQNQQAQEQKDQQQQEEQISTPKLTYTAINADWGNTEVGNTEAFPKDTLDEAIEKSIELRKDIDSALGYNLRFLAVNIPKLKVFYEKGGEMKRVKVKKQGEIGTFTLKYVGGDCAPSEYYVILEYQKNVQKYLYIKLV